MILPPQVYNLQLYLHKLYDNNLCK